jgi:hypothetical protein
MRLSRPTTQAGTEAGTEAGKTNSLLVEARSFKEHGGWVLDPQFEDQMGSPYLLAHGMGKPVANAATTVTFPSTGTYHLWVRTRDWCPGEWESPGRFRVRVAGEPLATVFGTEPGGWAWQRGGEVSIANLETAIELEDLTGFEGRCDALFFTEDAAFVPPHELGALLAWRRTLLGIPQVPAEERTFDLVVVGGGMAGCAAAVAAARSGLRVALVHDRPVLGGNASAEVRVHTLGISGKGAGIIGALDSEHWPNGSADAQQDDEKRHATIDAEPNITQLLDYRCYEVLVDAKRIVGVDIHHNRTGMPIRLSGAVFVDCTGDGAVGVRAGATYRCGRESKHEFDEEWGTHGELWSPEESDRWTMGTSLLWNSREAADPVVFPDVPWAMPVAKEHAEVNGEWYWEFAQADLDQVEDGEQIRDHLFRAICGSFANAKAQAIHARCELVWVGYISGRRESRRLLGDHVYSMQDIVQSREFEDAVAEETRDIDVHYQRVLCGHSVDFISEALFFGVAKYYVPFRSLYSKDIDNLMMAGRCISATHVALGGPRVMRTTAQMGIATGYAACLCKRYGKTPREIGQQHITELRQMIGYTSA